MKEKIKGWIFGVIVLIILLIPIITDYYKSKSIEVISYIHTKTLFQTVILHYFI